MLSVRLLVKDNPESYEHLATDYIVYEDKALTKKALERLNEKEFKTFYTFNEKLDPEKRYYVSARMLLNTGWTEPSVVEVFNPYDNPEIELEMILPSVIKTTKITILDEDIMSHRLDRVKARITSFDTADNIDHSHSSWVLEDIDGKTITTKLQTTDNKEEVEFVITDPEDYLITNSVYRVKCIMTGSNNDSSGTCTTTFITTDKPITTP